MLNNFGGITKKIICLGVTGIILVVNSQNTRINACKSFGLELKDKNYNDYREMVNKIKESNPEMIISMESPLPTDYKEPENTINPVYTAEPDEPEVSEEPEVTEAPEPIGCDKTSIILGVGEKWNIPLTNVKGREVVYTSNSAKASVSVSGKITGKSVGRGKVYATCSGKKVTISVNIKKAPTSIKLSKSKLVIKKGKSKKIKVRFNKNQYSFKITWNSSDSSIAEYKNGKVIAKKKGTATISAKTFNGKKAKVKVTVE